MGEVPRLQKRKIPNSLNYYESKFKDQKKAILNAYLSGGYTLKELGDHFGKHYSTISRIIKEEERGQEERGHILYYNKFTVALRVRIEGNLSIKYYNTRRDPMALMKSKSGKKPSRIHS